MSKYYVVYLASGQIKDFDKRCDHVSTDGGFVRLANNADRKRAIAYIPIPNILWIECVEV